MTKNKPTKTGGTISRQKLVHTFNINHKSDIDDRVYTGAFTCKKLAIRELATLGVRKAQLNGGFHHDPDNPGHGVDLETDSINDMIAHLEVALVSCPDWWRLDSISDMSLLMAVFREVMLFESKFLRHHRQDDEGHAGSGEEGSEEDQGASDAVRAVEEVVDEEVPASLQP